MKKKIVKKKTYNIEIVEYSDGKMSMKRTCYGFNPFELLGLLEFIQDEINEQIKGKIKPDIIERKVIVDKN